jgi:hypothetical protein
MTRITVNGILLVSFSLWILLIGVPVMLNTTLNIPTWWVVITNAWVLISYCALYLAQRKENERLSQV